MKKILNQIIHLPAAAWRWYKGLYKGRAWYTKALLGVVSFVIAFILYLVAVDINFLWLFGKSPGMSAIMNPTTAEASEIYSADGQVIGKFFSENRTPVQYEDVNPVFWEALISTEDERFFHHFGIDFGGVVAAAKDYVVHHDARGASTITQQLVKNMFRVRTMYANTVDFGSNAFGIKTACKTYFGTTPQKLTADQAAILVGMLKATTFYNPRLNPKNSLKRRNVVLNNMLAHGFMTQAAYDTLRTKPIKLDYSVESNYDGQAQYFREAVANELKEWCEDNGLDLYTSGLKIYTTIDTRMQKYAEEAAVKQMRQVQRNFDAHWGNTNPWQDERHQEIAHFIEDIAKRQPYYKFLMQKFDGQRDSVNYYLNIPHKVKLFDYENGTIEKEMSTMDSIRYMVHFMHCGFVAMEPQTGHVKAWVGDIDFKSWKYDKVTAMRQPGSTFKLFVYTEAMNQGMTPCDTRRDEYISMKVMDNGKEKTWAPTNANGYFTGADMPLKSAFAQSINSVAVKLGQEVGIQNIVRTAHNMGINSELNPTPSLALGASDVNLLELVNSYATVANNGVHQAPVLVTKIVDREGNEIYKTPHVSSQAIPYRSAFLMQQLLMGGMREPGGTSMSMWTYVGAYPDTEFGGKTGTSNNHSDAWFVGVSPNLVAGAWVGGEYRSIHFRTGALGQGSRTALPICGYFFQSVLGDPAFKKYHGKFSQPKDADINASLYNCQGVYYQRNDSDSLFVDSLDVQEYELEGEEIKPEQENGEAKPVEGEVPEKVSGTPLPQGNGEAVKPE